MTLGHRLADDLGAECAELARRTEARVRLLAVHRQIFGTESASAELHARLQERIDAVAAELAEDIQEEASLLEGDPAKTGTGGAARSPAPCSARSARAL